MPSSAEGGLGGSGSSASIPVLTTAGLELNDVVDIASKSDHAN